MKPRVPAERNWLFWDETTLASKTAEELAEHVRALRERGARRELMRLARRFVERAKGVDTIRLFTREEIRAALEEIERSDRSLRFTDPVRVRMYKRFLRETGG